MKLEQHIYASYKEPLFSRTGATTGISPLDRAKLEERSLYYLPDTLFFRRETEGPPKYVYYPLDDRRLVIGKAVYTGRDILGRQGNYVFHNLVIPKEELLSIDLNPVPLIEWLDNRRYFSDRIPQGPLNTIDVPPFEFVIPQMEARLPNSALSKILHFCNYPETSGKPLLILGTAQQCLDFLNLLYCIIQIDLRNKISFDTYSYGTDLGYKIICVPDEAQFDWPIEYALKLNLTNMQLSSGITPEEMSARTEFVTQIVSSGFPGEINTMYKLEYLLRKEDYDDFKSGVTALSPAIRDFLLKSNRSLVMNRLAACNDTELLQLIIYIIEQNDFEVLASNYELIRELIRLGDDRILAMFTIWLYKHKSRTEFYPLLFYSPLVLKIFLNRIGFSYYDLSFFVESFELLPENYSAESEEIFLQKTFQLLTYLKTDKKLGPAFYQTLNLLSEPQSEKLGLLRRWIEFELSGKEELLEQLVRADISEIPEKHRDSFADSVLNGITGMRDSNRIRDLLTLFFIPLHDKHCFIDRAIIRSQNLPVVIRDNIKQELASICEKLPGNHHLEPAKKSNDKISPAQLTFFKRFNTKLGRLKIRGRFPRVPS